MGRKSAQECCEAVSGEHFGRVGRLLPGGNDVEGAGQADLQQATGSVEEELTCASGTADGSWAAQAIESGEGWEISPASCPYAWLILKGSAWDSQLPLRASISKLSLAEN